jgi:hypothetical protein
MISLRDVFESRMTTLATEMIWSEEQDCALRALNNTGEVVSILFGDDQAATILKAIRTLLTGMASAPGDIPGAAKWPSVTAEDLQTWPGFLEELRSLLGFANLGIFPPWDRVGRQDGSEVRLQQLQLGADVPGWVRDLCARIDRLVTLAPETEPAAYDRLLVLRAKASARLKFDLGAQLTPQELADLSGVSLKRVQNASYEAGEGAPVYDRKGTVTQESAEKWLSKKGFLFSIWRDIAALSPLAEDWGRDVAAPPQAIINDGLEDEVEAEQDFLFVPVDKDGRRFLPDLIRNGGYTIGSKGSEQTIANYFEALEALTRQTTPRWRRPNDNEHWGIVAGRGWDRVTRSSLDALAKPKS